MASNAPALKVVFSPATTRALAEVWNYNAEHRGVDQADRYEAFLKERIFSLAYDPTSGKIVKADESFRYLVVQKRPKDNGHVVGNRIDPEAKVVRILRIYHTKQDWQTYLNAEEP